MIKKHKRTYGRKDNAHKDQESLEDKKVLLFFILCNLGETKGHGMSKARGHAP